MANPRITELPSNQLSSNTDRSPTVIEHTNSVDCRKIIYIRPLNEVVDKNNSTSKSFNKVFSPQELTGSRNTVPDFTTKRSTSLSRKSDSKNIENLPAKLQQIIHKTINLYDMINDLRSTYCSLPKCEKPLEAESSCSRPHLNNALAVIISVTENLLKSLANLFDQVSSELENFTLSPEILSTFDIWPQKNKFYLCRLCEFKTTTMNSITRHVKLFHGNDRPKVIDLDTYCSICERSFSSSRSLKEHFLRHAPNIPSNECNKAHESSAPDVVNEFDQSVDVQNDLNKSSNKIIQKSIDNNKNDLNNSQKNIQCEICMKDFTCQRYLRQHINRCHKKPFPCDQCDKRFRDFFTFQIHSNRHKGIKPFHCGKCSAKFCGRFELDRHVAKCHRKETKSTKIKFGDEKLQTANNRKLIGTIFRCGICKQVLHSFRAMQNHLAITHTSKSVPAIESISSNPEDVADNKSFTQNIDISATFDGEATFDTDRNASISDTLLQKFSPTKHSLCSDIITSSESVAEKVASNQLSPGVAASTYKETKNLENNFFSKMLSPFRTPSFSHLSFPDFDNVSEINIDNDLISAIDKNILRSNLMIPSSDLALKFNKLDDEKRGKNDPTPYSNDEFSQSKDEDVDLFPRTKNALRNDVNSAIENDVKLRCEVNNIEIQIDEMKQQLEKADEIESNNEQRYLIEDGKVIFETSAKDLIDSENEELEEVL